MMNFLLVLSIIGILTSTMYALLVAVGRSASGPAPACAARCARSPRLSACSSRCTARNRTSNLICKAFLSRITRSSRSFFARAVTRIAGLEIARRVAARYPKIRSRFLCSGNAPYANAKVWSLERMQSAAAHRFFVVSDSDVSVTPGYLRAVMAPFADERVGLVTCLYRGVGAQFLVQARSGRHVDRNVRRSAGGRDARRHEVCPGADDGGAA